MTAAANTYQEPVFNQFLPGIYMLSEQSYARISNKIILTSHSASHSHEALGKAISAGWLVCKYSPFITFNNAKLALFYWFSITTKQLHTQFYIT